MAFSLLTALIIKYNQCCDRPAASPRVRRPAGTAAAAGGGGQPTRTAVTVTVASSGNAVTGLLLGLKW